MMYSDITSIEGMENIFEQPERIWNVDETGFVMDGTTKQVKILGEKGCRRTKVDKQGDTSQLTVLFCGNAAGRIIEPMILVNGVNPGVPKPHSMNMGAYPGAKFWKTPSGWSKQSSFVEFIRHMDERLEAENAPRPQLLILDGVSSHLSFEASMLAKKFKIEIYVIPPNSSSMVQPLDLSWMGPIKTYWDQAVRWYQKLRPGDFPRKKNFPVILKEAVRRGLEENNGNNIKEGFRKAGIYPYDPEAPFRPENEKLYKGDKNQARIKEVVRKLDPSNYNIRIPPRPKMHDPVEDLFPEHILSDEVKSVKIVTEYHGNRHRALIERVPTSTLQHIASRRKNARVCFFTCFFYIKNFTFFFHFFLFCK
jgi:hypothetical protein